MSARMHGRARQLAVVILLVSGVVTATCGDDQVLRPEPGVLTEAARPPPTRNLTPRSTPEKLQLTSSAFADNGSIPQKYTCDGEEKSPPLAIAGGPEEVETFAIIVTDIDGPGGDFVHWTIWNIAPTTTEIPEGTVPQGSVQGKNRLGGNDFAAPCPPSGVHRYVFDLYALNRVPAISRANGKAELLNDMKAHVLDQAQLTGTYGRDTSPAPTVP